MKIVSWNVAGFRACLNKGFSDFFDKVNADVFAIQESKVLPDQFKFEREEYEMILNPAEKKGYSGTLIYTRVKPLSISFGMGIDEHDHEGRIITLEFNDFYFITEYVPNVKRDLSRLEYRMKWEDDFRNYLKKLEKNKPVVVCGDLNVAHNEIDIRNAKANIGNAGFTYEERGKFTELLNSGFIDTFRYFNKDEIKYSWWSYMGKAREKNVGWRIDYFVVSEKIINKASNAVIYDNIYGSDHCPIGLDINMN